MNMHTNRLHTGSMHIPNYRKYTNQSRGYMMFSMLPDSFRTFFGTQRFSNGLRLSFAAAQPVHTEIEHIKLTQQDPTYKR